MAAGGVAKALIRRYGMEVRSHVVQVGPEEAPVRDDLSLADFEGVDESPVRALDADGIEVAELQLHQPSLDDVFLQQTGRSLEGEEEEPAS